MMSFVISSFGFSCSVILLSERELLFGCMNSYAVCYCEDKGNISDESYTSMYSFITIPEKINRNFIRVLGILHTRWHSAGCQHPGQKRDCLEPCGKNIGATKITLLYHILHVTTYVRLFIITRFCNRGSCPLYATVRALVCNVHLWLIRDFFQSLQLLVMTFIRHVVQFFFSVDPGGML